MQIKWQLNAKLFMWPPEHAKFQLNCQCVPNQFRTLLWFWSRLRLGCITKTTRPWMRKDMCTWKLSESCLDLTFPVVNIIQGFAESNISFVVGKMVRLNVWSWLFWRSVIQNNDNTDISFCKQQHCLCVLTCSLCTVHLQAWLTVSYFWWWRADFLCLQVLMW